MLAGILDATTRISAIARQASDLATWIDGRAGRTRRDTRRRVRRARDRRCGVARPAIEIVDDAAKVIVRTPNAASLAAALSMVDAVGRGLTPDRRWPAGASRSGSTQRDDRNGPATSAAARPTAAVAPDQGGHGLALVPPPRCSMRRRRGESLPAAPW
jgi:hypothetical protein